MTVGTDQADAGFAAVEVLASPAVVEVSGKGGTRNDNLQVTALNTQDPSNDLGCPKA